ncbi:MAG TPA: RNase adapter RapZ [Vicinamibacterales bacterium]|nr:RNase adapter RapZ [Vicinamibacterales bacterium]
MAKKAAPKSAARPRPAAARRSSGDPRFIILTGLSGSGKSQAIRALEDLGYFCVDNMPTTLIPTLVRLSRRAGSEISRIAVTADVREGAFLSQFPKVFRKLRRSGAVRPMLIFLEATPDALVRRFSESRRPHPLAHGRSVSEGIREERRRLEGIRGMADAIVDTSHMTVHELRRLFQRLSRGQTPKPGLVMTLLSFGFKHGLPVDADLVFDVRCLPNPHFVPSLRPRTGRDRAVIRYMERDEGTREFVRRLIEYLRYLVPQYVDEGKSYLTVAIGCTGGRHRSVMVAESVRHGLEDLSGVRLRLRHRDILLDG